MISLLKEIFVAAMFLMLLWVIVIFSAALVQAETLKVFFVNQTGQSITQELDQAETLLSEVGIKVKRLTADGNGKHLRLYLYRDDQIPHSITWGICTKKRRRAYQRHSIVIADAVEIAHAIARHAGARTHPRKDFWNPAEPDVANVMHWRSTDRAKTWEPFLNEVKREIRRCRK